MQTGGKVLDKKNYIHGVRSTMFPGMKTSIRVHNLEEREQLIHLCITVLGIVISRPRNGVLLGTLIRVVRTDVPWATTMDMAECPTGRGEVLLRISRLTTTQAGKAILRTRATSLNTIGLFRTLSSNLFHFWDLD